MKDDKEKWIEDVFDSIKGSKRAKPPAGLFAKIEGQFDDPEAKVILMPQWKMAIAAAAIILFLNVFAIQQFAQNNKLSVIESPENGASSQLLISNYKLYE